MNKNKNEDIQQFFIPKIAVLGLGYVGLPLFCLFSKHYHCVGFDSDNERTTLLSRGIDAKRCEKEENINAAIRNSIIVSNSNAIRDCNVFVICVPTGVTSSHEPDLFPLKSACFVVGSNLKKGDLVIFESTVFPGATDEICIPILEEYSGLTLNIDFGVGYSPERINVGEEIHHLSITPKIIYCKYVVSCCIFNFETPKLRRIYINIAYTRKFAIFITKFRELISHQRFGIRINLFSMRNNLTLY